MHTSEIILYTTEDGPASIQLHAEGETVWLTPLEMAELFQTTKQNISLHIKNILLEGEQDESVVKYHLTTASEKDMSNLMKNIGEEKEKKLMQKIWLY